MNDTVLGIILKQTDYKENAIILSVLTKEYGKISFIANGAKKMNGKTIGSILPYTQVAFDFDYRPNKTIFRMKRAYTKQLFRHIHDDLLSTVAATILAELTEKMCYEESDLQFTDRAYDKLVLALTYLNQKIKSDVVLAIFIANMMKEYGVAPNVDECVMCASSIVSSISVKDGGFLCASCSAKEHIVLQSSIQLKQFRLINKAKMNQIEIAENYIENAILNIQDLLAILKLHTGIEVRSFNFYQSLLPLNETI